jgi:histidyl-tRNA synthetase
MKKQMKKADKSGAEVALIIGADEIAQQQVTVKPLRTAEEQQTLGWQALIEYLQPMTRG